MAAATASSAESDTLDLPVIDLSLFLTSQTSPESVGECRKVAQALHDFGLLCVRDPRASAKDNDV